MTNLKIFSFLLISLICNFSNLKARNIFVDVRIYSTVSIQRTKITVFSGKYELLDKDGTKLRDFYKNNEITVHARNSKVIITANNETILNSDSATLKGLGFVNTFEIEALKPSFAKRVYDDNLIFKAEGSNLILINNIDLERYVAGVVESEAGGCTSDHEFFKVQSIAARTYALSNIRRHANNGHHLCDAVHCQAYKGRARLSHILMAAIQTAGIVIVDENDNMITAAFHSNSGGMTVNSEDVWTAPLPYLRSVVDTFSLGMRNSTWEVRLTEREWLNGLKKFYDYPIENQEKRNLALTFQQETRKTHFPENIHLRDIRRDFNLRSTFFSIEHKDETVILRGRGFGHGVGISQEGAIRMVQLGFTYRDIINFYYTNVLLKNFDELKNFNFNN